MSRWELLRRARDCEALTGHDLLVLVALAVRADDSGTCWPTVRTLAGDTRSSRRSVFRSIGRLCELGFVSRDTSGPGAANVYRITGKPPVDNLKVTCVEPSGGCATRDTGGDRGDTGSASGGTGGVTGGTRGCATRDTQKKPKKKPNEERRGGIDSKQEPGGRNEVAKLCDIWLQGWAHHGLEPPGKPQGSRLAVLNKQLGFECALRRLGNAFRSGRWREHGGQVGWLLGDRGSEYDEVPRWYVPDRIAELLAGQYRVRPETVRTVAARSGADSQDSLEAALSRHIRALNR